MTFAKHTALTVGQPQPISVAVHDTVVWCTTCHNVRCGSLLPSAGCLSARPDFSEPSSMSRCTDSAQCCNGNICDVTNFPLGRAGTCKLGRSRGKCIPLATSMPGGQAPHDTSLLVQFVAWLCLLGARLLIVQRWAKFCTYAQVHVFDISEDTLALSFTDSQCLSADIACVRCM